LPLIPQHHTYIRWPHVFPVFRSPLSDARVIICTADAHKPLAVNHRLCGRSGSCQATPAAMVVASLCLPVLTRQRLRHLFACGTGREKGD
jgi:hypothetical protein